LPIERGVCTDVVVRALREALNVDLQRLVHEDMNRGFSQYPTIWGLKRPDRNIDHRRVPNLKTYFERRGYSVSLSQKPADYLPGDLVTCTVAGNRPHIMIVSDRRTTTRVPFVIHDIGGGVQEEDRLFEFPITGHYRIKADGQTRTIEPTRVRTWSKHPGSFLPAVRKVFPKIRWPKSKNMALWGGFSCKHCDIELDKWGREIRVASCLPSTLPRSTVKIAELF